MSQRKSVLFYIGSATLIWITTLSTISDFTHHGFKAKVTVVIADVIAVMAIVAWYDIKRFFVIVRILSGLIFVG